MSGTAADVHESMPARRAGEVASAGIFDRYVGHQAKTRAAAPAGE
jgi:hypothetical protein